MVISKLSSTSNYWEYLILFFTLFSIPMLYFSVWSQWRRYKLQKKFKGFNTFPTMPIIGNLHLISGTMKERVRKILKLLETTEFPFLVWLSQIPIITIGRAENAQTVLCKTNNRRILGTFKYVFNDEGILWGNGEKWRKSRRLMNPAFSPTMLQQYLLVFNEQNKILMEKIVSFADTDKVIDLWPFMAAMNLDAVTLTKLESMRVTSPWLLPEFIYNIYLLFTGNWNVFKQVKELPRQIVGKKVQDYELNKVKYQAEETEGKSPRTVIDVLLKAHDADPEITKEQLQIEILSMIGAIGTYFSKLHYELKLNPYIVHQGSETSAITGSFTTLMFAMNPEIQEKAYQEVQSVFGDKPTAIKMEDLNELVYLEKCIKETLRKFPPVALTVRQHHEDIKLNEKLTIPANCQIRLGIYCIHHNKDYYSNPQVWNPERFDPQLVLSQPRCSFIPFGSGPRMCIGMKYAMISLKIQLTFLLSNYRFTTNVKMEDIKLTLDLTMRNAEGYLVKVWSRETKNK